MDNGRSKREKRTGYGASLIYYSCRLVGYLPWWFLYYVLAGIIYFFLYYIFRYRVKVARDNIGKVFPEKSKKELRLIERRFYRHLAEVFVDTIDLAGISMKSLRKRIIIENETVHRQKTTGKDWIAVTSHYGSWEYFMAYALGMEPNRELLGVYRPLHSKAFDGFYKRMRSRSGMTPVPMNMILRRLVSNREAGKRSTVGLIADQTPPRREVVRHWFDFLGRPTAFFMGMEKMALKFGMPVYFVAMDKLKRGHYKISFKIIWDGEEELKEFELTQRYAKCLEAEIIHKPEYWMWSHRRWKHKYPESEDL